MTLVAHSIGVKFAEVAAEELAKEGISCEIINLRSVRPLDMDTIIASVKKTNRLVTIEAGWPICGIGSEICAQIMECETTRLVLAPGSLCPSASLFASTVAHTRLPLDALHSRGL